MKKLFMFLFLIPIVVNAQDITDNCSILINGNIESKLTDNNENSYVSISKGDNITISSNEKIYGLYIIYEMKSVEGIISNNFKTSNIGANGFLHEYIDVNKLIGQSNKITIKYHDDVKIGEIYVLSKGDLPEYIEVWDNPCKEADLLLFSTHSDDEHLFFAGLIPTYIAKGADIQVVYFTNHNDNPPRLHEQIHGLYKVGIRHYPIIGFIPDAWSDNLKWAMSNLKKAGISEDNATKFEVQMIRRFKPLVIVGHDELGEYPHGQHILNTYVLKKAIILANDYSYDDESIEKYGLWDTPKTYLHLYKDNKIIMNYDIPLNYFNGLTAYEVSKIGYKEHYSQQNTWYTKWLTGVDDKGFGSQFTRASEIKEYSPCAFGLYRSLVGNDINKNDMFENLFLRKNEVKEVQKIVNYLNNKTQKIINNNGNQYKKYIIYVSVGLSILVGFYL